MGARTSNSKRGDEYSTLTRSERPLDSSEARTAKRPRFSLIKENRDRPVITSNSTISRLSRYPAEISQLRRVLHAPCRTLKLGRFKRMYWNSESNPPGVAGNNEDGDGMANSLRCDYPERRSQELDEVRRMKKDKEVIELDADTDSGERTSQDSRIKAMDTEDGREGISVISHQSLHEADDMTADVQELGPKIGNSRNQPSSSSVVSELTNGNLKVVNAEQALNALSPGDDLSSVSAYKRLLERVERRNSRLRSLDFEIELNEQRLSLFQLQRPERKPVEEIPREPFVPLTKEEETEVERAFSANRRKVLVSHANINIDITGENLQCLRPGAWLNDEVINLYLELLKERENREPKKFLKCHFFNTFFYKKLVSGRSGYDYKSVRRWTSQKKLGYQLIECDKIFVPIHKEIHWCLAVINKKEEKFQYLDSLGGMDSRALKTLAKYYEDEVKDKSGKDINVSHWEQEFVEGLPEQENGFDCGMFMIKYADFYSRGLPLCFNQEHMPYFRLRTAKEILRLRAD